jgi:hypothetical protein
MLKCSHILCRVNHISETVRDYEALGFTIQWGSAPKKALNAFIWFEEGPFIEFVQIPKHLTFLIPPLGWIFGRSAAKRWTHWSASSEGWCDVALEPKSYANDNALDSGIDRVRKLKEIKQAVHQAGIATSRVIHGRRTRPDGNQVRYSLFTTDPLGLPFVVSTYDPPQRPKSIVHPNGATGIKWVKMGAVDEQRHDLETLVQGDSWLNIIPSTQTKVLEVCLAGLTHSLDASLLHGAVFTNHSSG